MDNERYRKTMPIKIDLDSLREAQRACVPTLTVIKGKNAGSRIQICENHQYVIGRNNDCDIMIDDFSVSRAHAIVWTEWNENERVVKLKDLGSTNKTMLNGKEVDIEELGPGDKIFIGESLLLFEIQDGIVAKFYEEIINKAEESEVDALTKLLSKRFFIEALPKMYEEMVATGRCFSLIILDLDHFKGINDNFGHDVGDEILKALSEIVKKSIRKEDLGMRYGGDEIVIGLPNTDRRNAREIAERLRISVENCDCSHLNIGKKLSISVGVGSSHGKSGVKSKFEEIMKSADDALYESKRKGRNAVSTDEDI
ncbi:diguanylate cyclase [Candidatus Uabimicrobium sp. HlEnr_7]|uniref:diguanylate cyclase n=1 Tax=Candidatus Uabimicrobium helgolandensis TaxID=3095367 RepID=UPI0035566627